MLSASIANADKATIRFSIEIFLCGYKLAPQECGSLRPVSAVEMGPGFSFGIPQDDSAYRTRTWLSVLGGTCRRRGSVLNGTAVSLGTRYRGFMQHQDTSIVQHGQSALAESVARSSAGA